MAHDMKFRASDTYEFRANIRAINRNIDNNAEVNIKWVVSWLRGLYVEKRFDLGAPMGSVNDYTFYEHAAASTFEDGRADGRVGVAKIYSQHQTPVAEIYRYFYKSGFETGQREAVTAKEDEQAADTARYEMRGKLQGILHEPREDDADAENQVQEETSPIDAGVAKA